MSKKITVTITGGKVTCNGTKGTHTNDGNNGRNVYIAGQYVVKVDNKGYDHDDMGQWKRIEKKDRKYFVPTLAQGYTEDGVRWSVQPYVELDWDTTDEDNEIVHELIEKYGLFDIDTFDTSPRNWAMHKGQPVIFDYGLSF